MKKFITTALLGLSFLLAGCQSEADMASYNVSKAADNFDVTRRITVINGITDNYLLTIEGLCSLGNYDSNRSLSVTCKTGPGAYKKVFVGLSDNVTFLVEQVEPSKVSVYHYKVFFRPSAIVPDVDLK